jgi:hypothetical protein
MTSGTQPILAAETEAFRRQFEQLSAQAEALVTPLTEEEFNWRPSPEAWSVKDIVEHLGIAEPQYWDQLQNSLKAAASGYKPEATDAAILWYGIDRTNRTRTGEARVPDGRFKDSVAALSSFRKLRSTMLEQARTSQEDYRGRKLTDGNMDVYQWFLMISSHSQRHILQIREVKGAQGFPKR